MLFKPELIQKIVNGEKTQTRRPINEGDFGAKIANRDGIIIRGVGTKNTRYDYESGTIKGLKWQVGRDYSVQPGMYKKGVWWCTCSRSDCPKILDSEPIAWGHGIVKPLRIKITKIRKEKLFDISKSDARAEGFDSVIDFINYVCALYKGKSGYNPEMWVLDFEVVK